jgi:lysophospholipase L1-like esterase
MLAPVPRRRLLPWYVPAALALALSGVFGSGFVLALTGRFGQPLMPPTGTHAVPAEPPRDGTLRIVALGDSITRGTGDRQGGYAQRAAATLRGRGRPVALTNLSNPGDETMDLLRRMRAPEARRQIAAADLVVVSIGGNDLTHSLRPRLGGGAPPADEDLEAPLSRARRNLQTIVAELRALNPDAPVRLVGLYNPFEIAPEGEAEARAQLLAWNNAIAEATHAHSGVIVVPVADLFEGRAERLAADHFHPGPRGHALIAERLLSTLPGLD